MHWGDVIKINQMNTMKAETRNVVVGWDYLEIRKLGDT